MKNTMEDVARDIAQARRAPHRCYLAGPMRGIEHFNYPAFADATAVLRTRGLEVVNPAELDAVDNPCPPWDTSHEEWCRCLRRDLEEVVRSDAVIVLPGWQESEGARLEVSTARAVDIPVFRYAPERPAGYAPLIDAVLGLIGYAGVGKDALAGFLVDNHGWRRVAFADALKAAAFDMGVWDGVKDEHGRRLLQDFGVAIREYVDPDAWVKVVVREIERDSTPVVVTDVRFENEVRALRALGGRFALVVRPGVGPANEHVSEHLAADADAWVDIIVGNSGTLSSLERVAANIDREERR